MNTNESSGPADSGGLINTAFVMLPTKLLADVAAKKISEASFFLYAFMNFLQGKNKQHWYGIPSLAEKTGFSQGKVKRCMKELVQIVHVARIKRMGANWLTRCLTRVEPDGTVLVHGENVRRRPELLRPSGHCAAATVPEATALPDPNRHDWRNTDTEFTYIDAHGTRAILRLEEDEILSREKITAILKSSASASTRRLS